MKALIITAALFSASFAHAELKMVQKTQPIFLSQDGRQIDAVEAMKQSIEGRKVLKCDQVEAQASANGNVSLKKIK